MVTIPDIARRLELNKSTVSRALTNKSGMTEITRQRVLKVAKEMGYVPNPAARALARGRSFNVGLVSPNFDFHNNLYLSLLPELAAAADRQGCNLTCCLTGYTSDERSQNQLMHSGAVDGIFALPYGLPGLESPESPWRQRPLVFLLTGWNESRAPSVRFDDEDGARQVAEYLWNLGHRRVLYLQGHGAWGEISAVGGNRLHFLRAAWERLGAPKDAVLETGARPSGEGGYEVCKAQLERQLNEPQHNFTAVIAYNDQMALGALQAIRECGLRVPEDISLVGWNDVDESPQFAFPALTSVKTSPVLFAECAVELLELCIARQWPSRSLKLEKFDAKWRMQWSESPNSVPQLRVPVQLQVRASTGPAK